MTTLKTWPGTADEVPGHGLLYYNKHRNKQNSEKKQNDKNTIHAAYSTVISEEEYLKFQVRTVSKKHSASASSSRTSSLTLNSISCNFIAQESAINNMNSNITIWMLI